MGNTLSGYIKDLPIDDLPLFIKIARETGLKLSKITVKLHTVNLKINAIGTNLKNKSK